MFAIAASSNRVWAQNKYRGRHIEHTFSEGRGRLGGTVASCLMEEGVGTSTDCLKVFCFFRPSTQILEECPKLGHYRCPPHLLQFIIFLSSSHSTLYIYSTPKGYLLNRVYSKYGRKIKFIHFSLDINYD
jgi:hypothetical protein